jgi:hypothetical protein
LGGFGVEEDGRMKTTYLETDARKLPTVICSIHPLLLVYPLPLFTGALFLVVLSLCPQSAFALF